MTTSPGHDVLSDLDRALRQQRRVDLGLGSDLERVEQLPPVTGLADVRRLLVRRAGDLQAAVSDLSAAIQRLREQEAVAPFTELGWPERRAALEELLHDEPVAGSASWIDDWFSAVATLRLDAAQRLLALTQALPAGAATLLRRCRAATRALADLEAYPDVDDVVQRAWQVSRPILEIGAEGIHLGAQRVPNDEARQDLRVLLIRLALTSGRAQEAGRMLERHGNELEPPIRKALVERLERGLDGRQSLTDVLRLGSGSVDALLELARVLNLTATSPSADLRIDSGLGAARSAVAAAQSAADASSHLRRLLAPVPAELDLALGERALAEQDRPLAQASLRRAMDSAKNEAVRAEAADRLAELAVAAGDRDQELEHLLAAGWAWDRAGQPERAVSSYRRLVAADPSDPEARCRLAGVLSQTAWTSPKASAAEQVEEMLRLVATVPALVAERSGTIGDGNWLLSYAAWGESNAAARLARLDPGSRVAQQWRAVHAALRCVALQPVASWAWSSLADAAYELKAWSLAEAAADQAYVLDPSPELARERVRALANLGDFEGARAVIAEQPDREAQEFYHNVEAYMLLGQGKTAECLELFAAHPPEQDARWARSAYVVALFLAGRVQEGRDAAQELESLLAGQFGDGANDATSVRLNLLLGDDSRTERLAMKLAAAGGHEGDFELAVVRFAQHRPDEAFTLLGTYLDAFTQPHEAAMWSTQDVPLLRMLLADRGVAFPDLSVLDERLAQASARVTRRRDPIAELDEVEQPDADPDGVRAAKQLARSLLDLAAGDHEAVSSSLPALEGQFGADLVAPLAAWARQAQRQAQLQDQARVAVTAAEQGRSDDARRTLASMLAEGAAEADAALRGAAPADLPAPVLSALRSLATDPEVGDDASAILLWHSDADDSPASPTGETPAQEPETVRPLIVVLPPSGFDGYTDPVTEHELFLTVIPQFRLGADTVLPPVLVRTEYSLEPDGYEVLVRDGVVEAGRFPVGVRLLPDGAAELLPELVTTAVPPELSSPIATRYGAAVDSGTPATPGVQLLSDTPLEAVFQRVVAAAEAFAEQLAETGVDHPAPPAAATP